MKTELGIDTMQERIYQKGRVWVAITKWTNRKSNVEYQLITGQTEEKVLITKLNDEVVFKHEIKSGSNENVTKYHRWARNEIFRQQK